MPSSPASSCCTVVCYTKKPIICLTPRICKLGPSLSSALLWWPNTGSLMTLPHFQHLSGSSLNPLQHIDIFTPHSGTATRNKYITARLLPLLPPSASPHHSHSSAQGPSIQLTFAHFLHSLKQLSQKLFQNPASWSPLSYKCSFYALFLHSPASPYSLFA